MLDVHPPEHAAHTWRDFFIHIATIVVGLIIAVGLEQSVEYLHHRHQRIELEEALHADTVKAIQDSENENTDAVTMLQWLSTGIGQIQDALDTNRPVATPLPHPKLLDYDIPDNPAWKAAKSSGLLDLLPQDEVKAYSEVADVLDHAAEADVRFHDNAERMTTLTAKYERDGANVPDLTHATQQDLEALLEALLGMRTSLKVLNLHYKTLHGAEVAILKGDRDINSIQRAERNSW